MGGGLEPSRIPVALHRASAQLSVGLGGSADNGRLVPGALQMSTGARFGSIDGLNPTADATFLLPVGGRAAAFDTMIGSLNIQAHRRLTIALSAGGPVVHAGFDVRF